MKSVIAVGLFFIFSIASIVEAQPQLAAPQTTAQIDNLGLTRPSGRFKMTIDPFALLFGGVSVGVDSDFGPLWSGSANYTQVGAGGGNALMAYALNSFRVSLRRHFRGKSTGSSFMMGPELGYASAQGDVLWVKGNKTGLMAGAYAGFQFALTDFYMQLGASGGVLQSSWYAIPDLRVGWLF
ncbi:MAG: hypothetical protein IT289_10955 [Oligoflexia bacterium]|nr:hypothetical protein [Oligoflexia bacterium]